MENINLILFVYRKAIQCSTKPPTTTTSSVYVTMKHRSSRLNFPQTALHMTNDNKAIIVGISAVPEFSLCQNEASSTFNNKVCISAYPPSPCGLRGKLDFTLVFKRLILSFLRRKSCFNNETDFENDQLYFFSAVNERLFLGSWLCWRECASLGSLVL